MPSTDTTQVNMQQAPSASSEIDTQFRSVSPSAQTPRTTSASSSSRPSPQYTPQQKDLTDASTHGTYTITRQMSTALNLNKHKGTKVVIPPVKAAEEYDEYLKQVVKIEEDKVRTIYDKKFKKPWYIDWLRHFVALISDRAISTCIFLYGVVKIADADFLSAFTSCSIPLIVLCAVFAIFAALQQWYTWQKHNDIKDDYVKVKLDIKFNENYINKLKAELAELKISLPPDTPSIPKKTKSDQSLPIFSLERVPWFKRTWSVVLRSFMLVILLNEFVPGFGVGLYALFSLALVIGMFVATNMLLKNKKDKRGGIDELKEERANTESEMQKLELLKLKHIYNNPNMNPSISAKSKDEADQLDKYEKLINQAKGTNKPWTNTHRILSFLTIVLTTGIGSVFIKALSVGITPFDLGNQSLAIVFYVMCAVSLVMALLEFARSLQDIDKLEKNSEKLNQDIKDKAYDKDTSKKYDYENLLENSMAMVILARNDAAFNEDPRNHVVGWQLLNKYFKKGVYKSIKTLTLVVFGMAIGLIPEVGGAFWVLPAAIGISMFLISLAEYVIKTWNIYKEKTMARHLKVREFDHELVEIVSKDKVPTLTEEKVFENTSYQTPKKDTDDNNQDVALTNSQASNHSNINQDKDVKTGETISKDSTSLAPVIVRKSWATLNSETGNISQLSSPDGKCLPTGVGSKPLPDVNNADKTPRPRSSSFSKVIIPENQITDTRPRSNSVGSKTNTDRLLIRACQPVVQNLQTSQKPRNIIGAKQCSHSVSIENTDKNYVYSISH